MTQTKNTKATNVVAAKKLQTKDGSALAVTTFSVLPVNCDVKSKTIESGTFLNFKSNVFGEYGIKNLSYALNNAQLDINPTYGSVSATVSIFVQNANQLAYYADKIKKGAKLRIVQADVTVSKEYGLQLNIKGGNIHFIEDPTQLNAKITLDDGAAILPVEDEFSHNPFLEK